MIEGLKAVASLEYADSNSDADFGFGPEIKYEDLSECEPVTLCPKGNCFSVGLIKQGQLVYQYHVWYYLTHSSIYSIYCQTLLKLLPKSS